LKKWISYAVMAIGIFLFYQYMNPKVNFKENSQKGIQFTSDNWATVLSKAKTENKLIFLDVYATWCGPCKRLKKYTFNDIAVGEVFNKKYINVSFDAEAGEGIAIANKYEVDEYPTILFINADGAVIKKETGYYNVAELLNLSESIQ
jgi:thioredoxin 1